MIITKDKTLFICALLLFALLIVFRQTVDFSFIAYDDELYVAKNPHLLQGLTRQGISWALSSFHAANWHPLTWLSLILDFEIYGMNAGGYHLTNVVIHFFGAFFLFITFREMTGAIWKSAVVAAIFLIHPLHVESVASVAGRKDVLSGLFWSLTVLAYIRYAQRPALARYLLSAFFLFLGLMSKPTVVTLPFALLLLDYWPLRRTGTDLPQADEYAASMSKTGARKDPFRAASFSQLLIEKIPLLLLAVLASLLTWEAQKGASAIVPFSRLPLETRLTNAAVSYIHYLWKTIWPTDLSFFYPYTAAESTGLVVFSVFLLAVISALGWKMKKSAPWFIVGWLWFIITLLPVIGIVQTGSQAMADRYTYIPMIGLSFLAVWGSTELRILPQRKGLITTAVWLVILTLLIADSRYQAKYWQNSSLLFQHALVTTKRNYLAHNNLGAIFLEQKRYDAAEFHFREALRIRPDYADAANNLGRILEVRGEKRDAEMLFRKVLTAHPDNGSARRLLCDLLQKTGRRQEAISCYNDALEKNPGDSELHNNIAVALAGGNRTAEAVSHLEKALRLRPGHKEARENLDRLLAQKRSFRTKRPQPPAVP